MSFPWKPKAKTISYITKYESLLQTNSIISNINFVPTLRDIHVRIAANISSQIHKM
jgi:hypothetical protein